MSSAARTYGRALLDAAPEQDAARIAQEFVELGRLREEDPKVWETLTSPTVSASAVKATLDRVLTEAHPMTRSLLKLLVDNGRLAQAPEITDHFCELVKERDRQLDVHVTSAVELSGELRERLEQRLSESTGKQVRLHTSIDPDIIGGLVVRHGDTLIDTSLRGRLDGLRLALSRPVSQATASSAPSSTDS